MYASNQATNSTKIRKQNKTQKLNKLHKYVLFKKKTTTKQNKN